MLLVHVLCLVGEEHNLALDLWRLLLDVEEQNVLEKHPTREVVTRDVVLSIAFGTIGASLEPVLPVAVGVLK